MAEFPEDRFPLVDRAIIDLIEPNSRVLDMGCGTGGLLEALVQEKKARVQGIEISEEAIYQCVAKGLSVFHGDIESGLSEFPNGAFDYVILNQTLQEVRQVDFVIEEALRVGGKVILSFPNFAHYSVRFHLMFRGKGPIVKHLPHLWHDTPSVRFLSLRDFRDFCRGLKIKIVKAIYLSNTRPVCWFSNLRSAFGVFVISR